MGVLSRLKTCDLIRSCVDCLMSTCTYIVQTCKAICVSNGYTTSEETCLSVEGPKTISQVADACLIANPTYVNACTPCPPQTNSTLEWWYIPAGVMSLIGIGLGIIRYLNFRRNPRWVQFCRLVTATFNVLHFIVQCVWDWGLVSIPIILKAPPMIERAEPNGRSSVEPSNSVISDGEEDEFVDAEDGDDVEPDSQDDDINNINVVEFGTENAAKTERKGWQYPMTDDEDD